MADPVPHEPEHEHEDFSVKDAFGLPDQLPPLRLPPDEELAAHARTIPLMRELAALAEWLGESGKPVDFDGTLEKDDLASVLEVLGVSPQRFAFLWKYASMVGWAEIAIADAGTDEGGAFERAYAGEMAGTWAAGAADGVFFAWSATFAAVLSEAISVAAEGRPGLSPGIDLRGPGIGVAMLLFLNRHEGLFREEVRLLVQEGSTADLTPDQQAVQWDEFLAGFDGEPADVLLQQLAEVGAVTLPETDDGVVRLTPLALREMHWQLTDGGVEIPLLPATAAELTPHQLLAMADGVTSEEFEAEADAWIADRGEKRAAAQLLDIAAESAPSSRMKAVSVVTRIGSAAEQEWRDRMEVPAIRPYAKVALARQALGTIPDDPHMPGQLIRLPSEFSPDALSADLRPLPEDLAWVIADVLSLCCDDEYTDPEELATAFAHSVPADDADRALDVLWRSSHPEAVRVLDHLGQYHPDRKIAKEARRAAFKAASAGGPETS